VKPSHRNQKITGQKLTTNEFEKSWIKKLSVSKNI